MARSSKYNTITAQSSHLQSAIFNLLVLSNVAHQVALAAISNAATALKEINRTDAAGNSLHMLLHRTSRSDNLLSGHVPQPSVATGSSGGNSNLVPADRHLTTPPPLAPGDGAKCRNCSSSFKLLIVMMVVTGCAGVAIIAVFVAYLLHRRRVLSKEYGVTPAKGDGHQSKQARVVASALDVQKGMALTRSHTLASQLTEIELVQLVLTDAGGASYSIPQNSALYGVPGWTETHQTKTDLRDYCILPPLDEATRRTPLAIHLSDRLLSSKDSWAEPAESSSLGSTPSSDYVGSFSENLEKTSQLVPCSDF